MVFKGRTVIAFILIAMFASSILTLTIVDSPNSRAEANPSESSKNEREKKLLSVLKEDEIQKIATTYELIRNRYITEVDRQKVMDGAISGMLNALEDPYTVYMDTEETQEFSEHMDSTFSGIGAEVTLENGKVTVMSPIKGSPAEKAGVHAKDIIVSVNGISLDNMSLTEAVSNIRGPKGTQARLKIIRPGVNEPIDLIVVRDDIMIDTVSSELLEGNLGLIVISQFSQSTDKDFATHLKVLEEKGMKALIIDVRNNPGGYLMGVVNIIEPLIPKGKVLLQMEYRGENPKKTVSTGNGKNYPIAVLMNEGSASASEILAAAIKESANGVLVGQNTFGKGTVQITYEEELGDGSNIKMTIAKWLTPNGNWINKVGVNPDLIVDQPDYFKVAPISKKEVLKVDMFNEDVKSLQMMLYGLKYDPGRKDGYFNKQTETAVKSFQKDQGLQVTGSVDEKTATRLEEQIIIEIQKPENDSQLREAIQYLLQ